MSTTDFYQHLLQTMPPDHQLERNIFGILQNHIGKENRITLEDLSIRALGVYNTSTERQVREAIETLRAKFRVPVLSVSGVSGRWLARDKKEIEETLREMESRRTNLDQVIRSLRQAQVPTPTPDFNRRLPEQPRLDLWR